MNARNKNRIFPSLLLVVSVLLSACAVESEQPLSSPRHARRDARLEGLWRGNSDGNTFYIYVAYGAGARGSIMMFGKDKARLSASSFSFFVTQAPRHSYLNLIPLVEIEGNDVRPKTGKLYTFEEYRFVKNDRLVVSLIGGDAFSKAIASGKLQGRNDGFTTVLQTASERLLEFVENSNPKEVRIVEWTAQKIGNR